MQLFALSVFSHFEEHSRTGQVKNSETSEITETSESDFPMFPFLSFRLRHRVCSKTRKMKARKIFSEVPRFSRDRVFELPLLTELSKEWVNK